VERKADISEQSTSGNTSLVTRKISHSKKKSTALVAAWNVKSRNGGLDQV